MPLGSLQLPAKNTKNQLTIDPHDFFSIGDKNYKST